MIASTNVDLLENQVNRLKAQIQVGYIAELAQSQRRVFNVGLVVVEYDFFENANYGV